MGDIRRISRSLHLSSILSMLQFEWYKFLLFILCVYVLKLILAQLCRHFYDFFLRLCISLHPSPAKSSCMQNRVFSAAEYIPTLNSNIVRSEKFLMSLKTLFVPHRRRGSFCVFFLPSTSDKNNIMLLFLKCPS